MAKEKKKFHSGLGKGLGALLPSIEFDKDKGFRIAKQDGEETSESLAMIETNKIHHNPYQPRQDFNPQALEDLTKSIKQHGIIQPITVRREIDGYELIAGERRLRAAIASGLNKVPAYVLDIDRGVEMLEMALIENVQREDLNPIEIASGYQRLIEECRMTQEQVANKVGKDRTTVTNFLRLLRLPDKIQESLRAKGISMGHARAMLALSSNKKMSVVWKEVTENGLSVRATEKLVQDIESGLIILGDNGTKNKLVRQADKEKQKAEEDRQMTIVLEDNENRLRHIFGTQVRIKIKSKESGAIELEFYSMDDLERLLELFEIIAKANG